MSFKLLKQPNNLYSIFFEEFDYLRDHHINLTAQEACDIVSDLTTPCYAKKMHKESQQEPSWDLYIKRMKDEMLDEQHQRLVVQCSTYSFKSEETKVRFKRKRKPLLTFKSYPEMATFIASMFDTLNGNVESKDEKVNDVVKFVHQEYLENRSLWGFTTAFSLAKLKALLLLEVAEYE
ncbi:hypothetical protein VCHA53O466_50284 [Vibrio chagasii]|nr:hypothetical protein VCHA53O466_50284 [Vibrio chagasii]